MIDRNKFKQHKKTALIALILTAMFFVGRGAGYLAQKLETERGISINSVGSSHISAAENWGLGGYGNETQPTGIATAQELAQYDAYYVGDTSEKVIYLTFDAGYENGNTAPILDALKKHNAPATFFIVGHYLESAPDLVKRMVDEGHCVGNHTYNHLDMSKISDKATFQKEMNDVAKLFQEITGKELTMYYRPPQGKYSTTNLQMAQELGYQTFSGVLPM